jgi:hypothetical protein
LLPSRSRVLSRALANFLEAPSIACGRVGRLMARGNGLEARETGLQHAAFVVATAFMAVLVAEVDFHSGDLVGEPAHGALHHGLDLVGQLVVYFNVAIGIELHSHASMLPAWRCRRCELMRADDAQASPRHPALLHPRES